MYCSYHYERYSSLISHEQNHEQNHDEEMYVQMNNQYKLMSELKNDKNISDIQKKNICFDDIQSADDLLYLDQKEIREVILMINVHTDIFV